MASGLTSSSTSLTLAPALSMLSLFINLRLSDVCFSLASAMSTFNVCFSSSNALIRWLAWWVSQKEAEQQVRQTQK